MVLHHDPRRGSRPLGDVTCHLLATGLEGSVEGLATLDPHCYRQGSSEKQGTVPPQWITVGRSQPTPAPIHERLSSPEWLCRAWCGPNSQSYTRVPSFCFQFKCSKATQLSGTKTWSSASHPQVQRFSAAFCLPLLSAGLLREGKKNPGPGWT